MQKFNDFFKETVEDEGVNESTSLNMTPDAVKRFQKQQDKNSRPKYQFLDMNKIPQKGADLDFYDAETGEKRYGILSAINKKTGIASIKGSDKKTYKVQAYPSGVLS